jgi:cytochrome c oxidase subunit 4
MATRPAEHEEHPGAAVHHAPSPATYYRIFGALIALTILTVGAAYLPMPEKLTWFHTPVALAIAVAKATLVLLFFMHLWHSPRLTWLVAYGSLLWLAILLALTFSDYLTRTWTLR